MKLTVTDIKGSPQGELQVSFEVIENGRGTQAVHDTVVAYLAAQRSGTASTKTMGEVAGTGKKPWKQKGTGMARAGSFASPLWRGGGVTFGPKPRDFAKKVNSKVKRLALRKALSERLAAGDVLVISEIKVDAPRTKTVIAILKDLQLDGKSAVFVTEATDENLYLSARNIPKVEVTTSELLNTYQVLRPAKLIFTKGAFEKLESRLK
ncbi:MAG: 50S ribosomal protein L4 [Verrucomicrobia bacterium]|nr:50S ribosomal protein L4 [Verrucomicrobiota bacterium]MBI3871093.1 50S ribosomal protein L4 [Verrucomicrobiota bacterium]